MKKRSFSRFRTGHALFPENRLRGKKVLLTSQDPEELNVQGKSFEFQEPPDYF